MDLNGEFYNPHKPGAAVTQVFPWGCKSAAELHADDGGISKADKTLFSWEKPGNTKEE